jgi:GNAT superfamily N-acetyltransferase
LDKSYEIEAATLAEAPAIRALIRSAYALYVPRIGREPAPMQADMPALIAQGGVYVLRVGGRLTGSIRLTVRGDALEVNDLVVDPAAQGQGLGRLLMIFAEKAARDQGLAALTLYTNEKMVENVALYPRLGFEETERRNEHGFDRIYFRKQISG